MSHNHDSEIGPPGRLSRWAWFGIRLLRCWRPEAATLLLLCITSVLWQCDPLILKWLLDHALPHNNFRAVFLATGLLAILQCCRIGTLAMSLYASAQCGQQLAMLYRLEIFDAAGMLPVEMLEGARAGDLVYSLEQDVDQVVTLGADILPALTRILLTVAFSVIVMWKLDRSLTLLTSLSIPLLLAVGIFSRTQLQRFAERSRGTALERSAFSTEVFTASIQIRALQAFDRVRVLYHRCVHDSVGAFLSERKRQIAYGCTSLFIIAAASTTMLGLGGSNVIDHRLTIGAYVAFYTYLVRLFEPINTAVDLFAKVQRGGVSIGRLRGLQWAANEPNDMPQGRCISKHETCTKYLSSCDLLECSNVSFGYGGGHVKVLERISFKATRGSILLLDGPTGCGKSTFLKILAGIYSSYDGEIQVDGVDIRTLCERERMFGFAVQNPILFSTSLRDNLLLGAPAATSAEIDEALYLSCSDRIVRGLHGGLDYHISQSGAGLSGGERQRIALARVLLQRRPILLLDEGLTGIDDATKAELLSRMSDYTANRITILVSHDHLCKQWANDVFSLTPIGTLTSSSHRVVASVE